MAQVLINIPDEAYKDILQNEEHYRIFEDKLHVAVIEGKVVDPNRDLISRDDVLKELERLEFNYSGQYGEGISRAAHVVKNIKSIDTENFGIARFEARQRGYNEGYQYGVKMGKSLNPQIKHGKWKLVTHYARPYRICSECEAMQIDDHSQGWNFCPHCGADMRSESEAENEQD